MVLPKNILIGVDFNAKVPAVARVFIPRGCREFPSPVGRSWKRSAILRYSINTKSEQAKTHCLKSDLLCNSTTVLSFQAPSVLSNWIESSC